jgi:dinuclear metal center YbgI/SA1388 family protein
MQVSLKDIKKLFEEVAPLPLQESYDNSGLLVGDENSMISAALVTLDVTEDIVNEAVAKECNLIIAHHPAIFGNLKKVTASDSTGRIIMEAIRNGIALYAVHTNFDNIEGGVNSILCQKLGITGRQILKPMKEMLQKLVTFCPVQHADKVREAMFMAGAGHIGKYDNCSFNAAGQGTFRAGESANPFVGKTGELHFEDEIRVETIFPSFLQSAVIKALLSAHPYEEVAYDIYNLQNEYHEAGAGMIGELHEETDAREFLLKAKSVLGIGCIRHTALPAKKIKKVAVCGGAGSFLIRDAMAAGADIFLTGDIKYHDFFIPAGRMILADIGHYESEQFTKELICTLLKKKFPTFAHFIAGTLTNPVNYL